MGDEGLLEWVPAKGGYTELNDGELLGGIFYLEVANIESIKLEGVAPRRAGDAGHFEVDGNEISGLDVVAKRAERRVEV